ncbi:hypothetical protein ADIS_3730 [Lunatimonas lonarensis]|uniref:Uncharacterized protein n=1 Tax=Lunatimonas lonarensis TaxID=1232681 RepID=R7ZP87_9BACT|nr:hypothetical protein [Lunatimonas lonarensis]EON75839.1 hypothetical protein ADIS_3730 [Lunatimonas lonarensis]
MKRFLHFVALSFLSFTATFAQSHFIGIQNGPRKGMQTALMNPAEISSLSKKVEVSLFSVHAGISNNILTFQDILDGDDLLDLAFEKADDPINLRTDIAVMGPAVGFSVGKWSFGIATQGFVRADIIDLDPALGDGLLGDSGYSWETPSQTFTAIASEYNQRIVASGWSELDFLVGREVFKMGNHHFSAGANLRLIFPSAYANIGMGELRATIIEDEDGIYLTDTRGSLNISYSDATLTEDFNVGLASLRGFALDLGGNYQWKKSDGKSFIHGGLAIKNLGGMSFRENSTDRAYAINIPANQRFQIDNLEGSLDEIEAQLENSGYFTVNRGTDQLSVNLPTLLNLYGEIQPAKVFQASLFIQRRLSNESNNNLITAQNMIVLTPRLVLGAFQLYSPWAHNQVSGLTGGLGLQIGGFFLGSNALLTGTMANSMQADVHIGFSFGIGNN